MSKENPQFVNLHVHTIYSMLDGMTKIPEMVKKAKDDGQKAVAITDHGVMHGVVEFFEECQKNDIKPIIGVEAYVAPRGLSDKQAKIDASPYHLILLAKDNVGYKNLIKLTTIAHLQGYYYKPRIDLEILREHSAGLVALSACVQGVIARPALESLDKAREVLKTYLEIFDKNDFFLEVQSHNFPEQKKANKLMFKLAEEFDLKIVATNDTHYLNKDDDVAQDALICLQTGRTVNDKERLTMIGDDYSFLTREEACAKFYDRPDVLENTFLVAQKCNVTLDLGGIIIPDFPIPEGHTLDSYFKEKCYLGLNWRYGSKKIKISDLDKNSEIGADDLYITKEIWQRFLFEYSVIEKMKYQGYFLIVSDFTGWAKNQGIAVGPGRGSGAGSIILYALNVTNLDPLKYDLLFERFLNPDRISMPDIDMDFADSRRSEVIDYVVKKYGKDRVAQIITFGTMAARMAVRDVGRVLSLSYSEVDVIAKLIPPGMLLNEALENVTELKTLYNQDANVKKTIDIAMRLEGVARHASTHAAGVVISKDPLTEYCPLQEAQKGDLSTVTQYSMGPIEHLGLLKFDFLGLSNLSIIQNCLRIIKKTADCDLDIDTIPLDDKKTYDLLSQGKTTGVFQLESDGMKRYLKELKPTTFEDVIAMVALYRPGPMQWIKSFIDRKHGHEEITYVHPKIKPALENTYGIIVYQEQVMQMSKDLAGFSGGQADTLRKAMGKKIKELMKKTGKEFIKGCVDNNVDKRIAEDLYQAMQDFAQYAFNKSHAACYAMIAYQTAYLKSHYPSEFMAALMTSNQDNLDKLAIDIDECNNMDIEVLPPSVNESFVDFGVVKESGNIRFGLSAIKNVGKAVAEEIVEERKKAGNYKDLKDFLSRLSPKVINKKSLEALAMSGALSPLEERNKILFNIDEILNYSNNLSKIINSKQDSLFGSDTKLEDMPLTLKNAEDATKKQILSWERELLGIYISEHPIGDYLDVVKRNRTQAISDISPELENSFVRLAGVITSIQKIQTRSNQKMSFVKIEDEKTSTECLIFPKVLEKTSDIIIADQPVIVDGFVSYKDGVLKILAENIYSLDNESNIPKFIPQKRRANSYRNGSTGKETEQKTSKATKDEFVFKTQNLKIRLRNDFVKEDLLVIKEILANHPGETAVSVLIPNDDGQQREIKVNQKVENNPVLIRKLKEFVGKDNVI